MRKLVCPCCGWSDFLKYDDDYYWHCMACGVEYAEDKVLTFEREVPDTPDTGYGVTIINTYLEDQYDDFIENYDKYYEKYVKRNSESVNEDQSEDDRECEDETEWLDLEEPSPFEEKK